jgi:glycosyltransferase involved in cell wall biosynthesis
MSSAAPAASETAVEVSVVMPCLNEARTLAACIREAQTALAQAGLRGEIVIADNGSTDGSQAIGPAEGARLVAVDRRGYGYALQAGIAAAHGPIVVMGDADGSYDFGDIGRFVAGL